MTGAVFRERAEAAEQERDEAREALRELLALVENAHYPPPHEQVDAFDAMQQARAVLARSSERSAVVRDQGGNA